MPTGNEDLNGALATAQDMCWDERIGYRIGGTFNPDTDCSGFVWKALHENGFAVGSSRFDTTTEAAILEAAGFTKLVWGQDTSTPEHGDIFMYDEGGGANGHTFFYAKNIWAYKNGDAGWQNCDGVIAVVPEAKVEASGTHNHPENGDQDNGNGAHTEVWAHTYSVLCSPGHTWYVFRWGATPPTPPTPPPTPPTPIGNIPVWLLKKIHDRNFR